MELSAILKYILSRLDNTTSWIGLIGFVLMITDFHTALFILFLTLFFLPEGNFSSIFKSWTSGLRKIEEQIDGE